MNQIPLNERLETKHSSRGVLWRKKIYSKAPYYYSRENVLCIHLVRCGHSSLLPMVSSIITLEILVDILPGTVISLAGQTNL